ncbi:MAG: hypothetical protein GF320_21515 [Armatimonadia bacterium]|nr:hypothetical protein [Armatimonadia bacterium]
MQTGATEETTVIAAMLLAAQLIGLQATEEDSPFYRASIDTHEAVWGFRDGIRVALWPHAIGDAPGQGGPRGLLRIGYPILDDGGHWLVNFIAIEPVVAGCTARSFSELEPSATDGEPGKVIEAGPPPGIDEEPPVDGHYPGHVDEGADHSTLRVCFRVEPFESGAHVYVVAAFHSDRPDEAELRAYREEGSAELAACILTATMGNYERLRELHLRGGIRTAGDIYGEYEGTGFAPHTVIPADDIPRTPSGDALIAATTGEEDPSATHPDPDRPWFWYYPGRKVTQYWRKPADDLGDDLRALVNARAVYWSSEWPIPGGVSFENFELVEPYRPGRPVVFGITFRSPGELVGP